MGHFFTAEILGKSRNYTYDDWLTWVIDEKCLFLCGLRDGGGGSGLT